MKYLEVRQKYSAARRILYRHDRELTTFWIFVFLRKPVVVPILECVVFVPNAETMK